MTTLCGKCGKPEPGCDCRPVAVPESGNERDFRDYAAERQYGFLSPDSFAALRRQDIFSTMGQWLKEGKIVIR